MNHQKLLCLYVLFRESREKYSHHWAVRKTGIRFYDTSSVRANVPPVSALCGVILPGLNTTWRVNQASSFKKLDKFLQICQNCTIILLFAPENTEMKTISLITHYYSLCAKSVVLNQGNFAPQRTLAISGDISYYHNSGWWGGLPPASSW